MRFPAHNRPILSALATAALCVLLLALPQASSADNDGATPAYVPGEVVVRYDHGGPAHVLNVAAGESVRDAVTELRQDPNVEYAVPNYVARTSAYPNDPGFSLQWNFWGPFGINMPEAWALAKQRGAPGGRGVTVAVLDTGVAYRTRGPYRRAPDLRRFVPGRDFIDDDRAPFDLNGHGTHVAGTIAEATNNRIGAAGIAYRARIMPVRTLDTWGAGDAVTISRGIRYAVRHHADVINMSLEFPPFVNAAQLPQLMSAIRYARRRGVVMTAVAGNGARAAVLPYPARAHDVIAVAATTEHGCRAEYSNEGAEVDVAAPGGGRDAAPADDPWDLAHCDPATDGASVYQQTFGRDPSRFELPAGYYGTSMAAPHVAGVAALVIASRRLGPHPAPAAVQRLIQLTARDIGPPGYDSAYGYGLVDAAAALR
jgi:serine protease